MSQVTGLEELQARQWLLRRLRWEARLVKLRRDARESSGAEGGRDGTPSAGAAVLQRAG